MLAWCEVAEEVNKEALTQVNEWVLDLFVRGQVELLGGDEDFYNEVDASLKDLELVEGIKDAQRKLASTKRDLDQEHERFFFAHDENLSYVAEHKFGEQYQEEDDEELDEERNNEADIDITLPKHLLVTVNR